MEHDPRVVGADELADVVEQRLTAPQRPGQRPVEHDVFVVQRAQRVLVVAAECEREALDDRVSGIGGSPR
jgi:hypothetical protein